MGKYDSKLILIGSLNIVEIVKAVFLDVIITSFTASTSDTRTSVCVTLQNCDAKTIEQIVPGLFGHDLAMSRQLG